jgi:hypothetical protein
MQHDDQIGAALERQPIAGLLIPALPNVAIMPDREDFMLARHIGCIIGAAVVDQDNVVDNILWDFAQRLLQRARRVVGWQHNADCLLADHTCPSPVITLSEHFRSGRRFVIVVELLLAFLFLRRE